MFNLNNFSTVEKLFIFQLEEIRRNCDLAYDSSSVISLPLNVSSNYVTCVSADLSCRSDFNLLIKTTSSKQMKEINVLMLKRVKQTLSQLFHQFNSSTDEKKHSIKAITLFFTNLKNINLD